MSYKDWNEHNDVPKLDCSLILRLKRRQVILGTCTVLKMFYRDWLVNWYEEKSMLSYFAIVVVEPSEDKQTDARETEIMLPNCT